jgi:hypothetical protein
MPTHPILASLTRLPGRIIFSWALAGGVIAGGLLVAATTLAGRSSSGTAPQVATLFFLLGTGAGLAHGGLLGYLSRNPARTRREVTEILLRAVLLVLPVLVISWVATLTISLTAATLQADPAPLAQLATTALAWVFGLAVSVWAAWEGLQGILAAFRRWPDFRLASVIMSVTFGALVTLFLSDPPNIWFTHLRVTSVGAVLLAFGASVWIALPVVIAGLRLLHRVSGRS